MAVTLRKEENIGIIELDQEDSKVNLLTADTIMRLDSILEEVKREPSLKALMIKSNKKDVFIAGADIKEIEQITEAKDGGEKAKAGQDVLNKIEDLKIPTIAVIDGVALGGGCELALACEYRLATFNEKVRIGLPEVNLGFVPGFGGTYRLPRIVGLSEGLKMILAGKPVDGKKALRIGLVDRLVPQSGLDQLMRDFANEVLRGNSQKSKYQRKKKKGIVGFLESSWIGQIIIFSQSRKSVLKLTKGFYPAPLKAIDVIKKTFYLNRTKALEIEAKTFGELAITDISKNLVQVFYLSEKYKKLSLEGDDDVAPMEINKCAILGAGIMGGGIAQLLSSKDIWSRLKDINHEAIASGLKAASKIYEKAVKGRRMTKAEAEVKMAHITNTLDYTGFGNLDMVIEAVVEKMEVKKKVFKELSEVTDNKTILATNTSALSVTEMAKETKDPSKVIGFHFFNPVHRMPLVEIITTPKTSKETIVNSLNLVKRLGKTPILVKDSCGFIVNRILLGYMNEAGRILEECGEMERIDKVMTNFGMPMGPFILSDEVGLDVGIKVLKILEESIGERFEPVLTFKKAFEKGFLGKKSRKGFYIYGKKRKENPEILGLLNGTDPARFNEQEYCQRMVYIMINEAARCLEDKIVDEPSAIDVGMIFGTGFPPFRGGLLRYADVIGIGHIVKTLGNFENKFQSDRFSPTKYLQELKDMNKGFYN